MHKLPRDLREALMGNPVGTCWTAITPLRTQNEFDLLG